MFIKKNLPYLLKSSVAIALLLLFTSQAKTQNPAATYINLPANETQPYPLLTYNGYVYIAAKNNSNNNDFFIVNETDNTATFIGTGGTGYFSGKVQICNSDIFLLIGTRLVMISTSTFEVTTAYQFTSGVDVFYSALNKLFFRSNGKTYVYDASSSSMSELKWGTYSFYAYQFATLNNKVYFVGGGSFGISTFETDGTTAGTRNLGVTRSFYATGAGAANYFPPVINGKILFYDNGIYAVTPKMFSGSTDERIGSISVSNQNAKNYNMITYQGKIYTVDLSTNTLYRYNGTDGTGFVSLGTMPCNGLRLMVVYNNKIYGIGFTQETGYEMWSTDGTIENTKLVNDIYPGVDANGIGNGSNAPGDFPLVHSNGLMYYPANTSNGYSIWCTNGPNNDNTQMLFDLNPLSSTNKSIGSIAGLVNTLFFNGYDGSKTGIFRLNNIIPPQTLTPSILITASSTTICASTPVTFTAAATNGGSSPVYQWIKNGNNVGDNSSTYTDDNLQNGDEIYCVLTSSDPNASPATAHSNKIVVTVNPIPEQALGTHSPSACNDDGSIGLTDIAGVGEPPFKYSLNNVDYYTNNVFTGLGAGTYSIYVKDAKGCSYAVHNIVLTKPDPLTLTVDVDNPGVCTNTTAVSNLISQAAQIILNIA
jgi:ELWxxDGT repeat protein